MAYGSANQFLNERLPIPKGLRLKAQGCEERATLGKQSEMQNPNGVSSRLNTLRCRNPVGVERIYAHVSQGRRVAPTLGFESERRWRSEASPVSPELRDDP